jgi:dipeptidase E
MDMVEETARAQSNVDEMARLKDIGLEPEEIDLRQYFGKPEELRQRLDGFDLIWTRGGNVFVLRRAYKQSGFDEILRDLLARDALVYGGYSAGVCLLAPTLRGLELVDQPVTTPTPAGYEAETIWEGLNIVPYAIAPHYKSDHPESADIDKVVVYFEEQSMPYKALRDGEVIVVNGEV